MDQTEIARVQRYFRDKFGAENLAIRQEGRTDGSAEVYMGDEFLGVIFRDDEDGEVSYAFHMAIMEEDLPANADR